MKTNLRQTLTTIRILACIALLATSASSQILFQKQGVSRWGLLSDFGQNGGQDFQVYDLVAGLPRLIIDSGGAVAIRGSDSNDNAPAGWIGEVIASTVAFADSIVAGATGVAKNLASIVLTAGDWDVSGQINFLLNAIQTFSAVANIGTGSGVIADDGFQVAGPIVGTATPFTAGVGVSLPPRRISLAATTTVYIVGRATWSGSALNFCGYIRARRMR